MTLLIKVVLIGDEYVGKTSIRYCFMGQHFDSNYIQTIGADLSIKNLYLPIDSIPTTIQYQIWDLAGQKSFSDLRSIYYRGLSGVIIVYDVMNRLSYDNVIKWINEIKERAESYPIPIILLANKIDLRKSGENSITTSEGMQLAMKASEIYYGATNPNYITFFETSAKTGENVEAVFITFLQIIISSLQSS